MGKRRLSRREALVAAAAAVGLSGCHREKPAVAAKAFSSAEFVWEEVASGAGGPGVRSRHGLAYDQGAGATVLFGGVIWNKGRRLTADTWELRAGRWSRVETASGPPSRHRGAMVYDPRLAACVLFAGVGYSDAEVLGDLWFA